MSNLSIDINGINNNVIPKINNAIKKMESAVENLEEISYSPEWFTFTNRNRVQRVIPSEIKRIKNSLIGVRGWLEDAEERFKQAEKNNDKIINSLKLPTDNIGILGQMSNKNSNKSKNSVQKTNPNVNLAAFFESNTESIFKFQYEGNLKFTQTEIVVENKKSTKLKDDPEIKKGLEELNNILNAQNKDLKDNAEEIKNKLTSNTNPYLKNWINGYFKNKNAENVGDIQGIISLLQKGTEELDTIIPDSENSNSRYYNSDTDISKSCYELFANTGTMLYSEEDWKLIQEYLKKNNLTWSDIKSEYREAIKELQEYSEQLSDKKNQIYQLERYIDLYPYTKITLKGDFKKYLERDYSDETVDSPDIWSQVLSVISFGLVKAEKNDNFNELTQEEKAIYFYLKEQYSEEEAKEYYKSLEDIINQRKGMKDALEYVKNLDITGIQSVDGLNNFLMTTGMGLTDGVWSFGEGLSNLFPGNGEIMSELQYKQAFLTSMLTQEINLDEIAKNYGKDSEEYKLYEKLHKMQDAYRKALGVNYNVASSIGSEAIPMALSLIPEVGQPLGIALSSLSDAGNAKATAYQSGVTGWNAYLYAGIRGISSAVITKSFAAIPGLSDNASTTFKGMIKGSVQARTICCCSAENRFIYS